MVYHRAIYPSFPGKVQVGCADGDASTHERGLTGGDLAHACSTIDYGLALNNVVKALAISREGSFVKERPSAHTIFPLDAAAQG